MLEYRTLFFFKHLSFVPTPKQYSQRQLDTDTENLSLVLEFRAHFKEANETQTSDQSHQPFKVKNKN